MNADARRPARPPGRRDTAGHPAAAGPVCTLGLDLGTSSAKAVVVDTSGTVLSAASAGYPVTSARAGYAESEPAHWRTAVTACAREGVHAAGARPSAIGLSGQMHGLVLASPDGGALRPAGWGRHLAAGGRQMLADVLEFPLHAVDVPAASGRGEPDPAMADFHRERHARFRHIVSTLKTTGASAGRAAGPPDGAQGAA